MRWTCKVSDNMSLVSWVCVDWEWMVYLLESSSFHKAWICVLFVFTVFVPYACLLTELWPFFLFTDGSCTQQECSPVLLPRFGHSMCAVLGEEADGSAQLDCLLFCLSLASAVFLPWRMLIFCCSHSSPWKSHSPHTHTHTLSLSLCCSLSLFSRSLSAAISLSLSLFAAFTLSLLWTHGHKSPCRLRVFRVWGSVCGPHRGNGGDSACGAGRIKPCRTPHHRSTQCSPDIETDTSIYLHRLYSTLCIVVRAVNCVVPFSSVCVCVCVCVCLRVCVCVRPSTHRVLGHTLCSTPTLGGSRASACVRRST